jgi:hypothetical protein
MRYLAYLLMTWSVAVWIYNSGRPLPCRPSAGGSGGILPLCGNFSSFRSPPYPRSYCRSYHY